MNAKNTNLIMKHANGAQIRLRNISSKTDGFITVLRERKTVLRGTVKMKKTLRETQTLRAGGAKNFRPAADPLPVGAGRPKFNHLEMVTIFTHKPSLLKIDARIYDLSW